MTEPTPTAKPSLHPAINTLFAGIRTGDPKIHNGLGLWPVFADCRPEPAYLTLVEALSLEGFKITEVSEGGSVPKASGTWRLAAIAMAISASLVGRTWMGNSAPSVS